MTNEQIKALYTGVMDRMVATGWLLSYTFTECKGFHLNWTERGGLQAMAIKRIAETYGLADDDRAPVCFDKLTRGESLPADVRPFKPEPELAALWREAVDQLGLIRDEDNLLSFVHTVLGWAPMGSTQVRFLPS
jgi:hypothetical protein